MNDPKQDCYKPGGGKPQPTSATQLYTKNGRIREGKDLIYDLCLRPCLYPCKYERFIIFVSVIIKGMAKCKMFLWSSFTILFAWRDHKSNYVLEEKGWRQFPKFVPLIILCLLSCSSIISPFSSKVFPLVQQPAQIPNMFALPSLQHIFLSYFHSISHIFSF